MLEWELFVHPLGTSYIRKTVQAASPPLIVRLVANQICAHFRKQLHARGVGRFTPAQVGRISCVDIDALAARLSERPFLVADRPSLVNVAVFGQVAPMVRWPMRTSVAEHARAKPPVVGFVDRMQELCFAR